MRFPDQSLSSVHTIADIYYERRSIEIFFREIEQNLQSKSFVGNTEDAVLFRICTTLTVYLLLACQKFMKNIEISVLRTLQLITLNLFGNRSLEEILNP